MERDDTRPSEYVERLADRLIELTTPEQLAALVDELTCHLIEVQTAGQAA